jgi:hypothetical protein
MLERRWVREKRGPIGAERRSRLVFATWAAAVLLGAASRKPADNAVMAIPSPRIQINPVASVFTPVGDDAASVVIIVVSIQNAGPGPVRLLTSCHVSSLTAVERLMDGTTTEWETVYVPTRIMRLDPACEIAPGTSRVDSARIRVATDPAFRVPLQRLRGTYRAVYGIYDPNAERSDSTVEGRGRELPEFQRRSASFRIER